MASNHLTPAQTKRMLDWLAQERLILTDVPVERIATDLVPLLGGNAQALLEPYMGQGSSATFVLFDHNTLERKAKAPVFGLEQLRAVLAVAKTRQLSGGPRPTLGIDAANKAAGCVYTVDQWVSAHDCFSCDRGNTALLGVYVPGLEQLVKNLEVDSKPIVALSRDDARLLKDKKDPKIDTRPSPGKKEFSAPFLEGLLGADWQQKLAGLCVDTNNPLPSGAAVYELDMTRISEIANARGPRTTAASGIRQH